MSRKILLGTAALLLIFLSAGCNFNNPPAAEEGAIGYYTKEVVLSTWVDTEETWWDEVETRLYDEFGKLTAVSKHSYEKKSETGYDDQYVISRTDVYEVDDEGNQELVEYYIYTYHPDFYQYLDDDGVEVDAVDYLLLRGEAWSFDDVLRYYYDVTYDENAPDADYETADYDYYLSIIDKRTSDDEITAEQYATYLTDSYGDKYFRTEKYFDRNQDDDELILSKEFASWYDTADTWNYLYDLYHAFRGEDNDEEFYYFTRYSRNESGNIYEQADYDYTYDGPKNDPGNLSFISTTVSPLVYDISFDNIGEKATVLTTEYDESGNITLDQRWYRGELTEYTSYAYDSFSELTDENRYTDGGTLLHDRTTIRFRDEILYGREYSVKEICEYKYYDYSESESQSDDDSRVISRMIRPQDSYAGLSDQQVKHIQYSKLNNNYRK